METPAPGHLAVGGGRIYLLNGDEPEGISGWRAYSCAWGGQPGGLNIWLKHILADAAGSLWGTNGEHSLYRIAP